LFAAEERNSYTFGKLEVNYPLNGVAREDVDLIIISLEMA